ncbi:hypothetical protein [Neptuniibacter sp. QD37_11]|uniref:hypothetical protein n=1 Tax=Neptuniibacter sp. QD37_11 TaxID=3398209 RepID=UPI0039F5C100
MHHSLTCSHPDFQQSIPTGVPLELLNDSQKAGSLHYRDQEGKEYVVPNIWYNRPQAEQLEDLWVRARNVKRELKILFKHYREWRSDSVLRQYLDVLQDDITPRLQYWKGCMATIQLMNVTGGVAYIPRSVQDIRIPKLIFK